MRLDKTTALTLQWNATQEELQANMQRNTFGMGVPLRIAMEKKIVSEVSINIGEVDRLTRQSLHHPLLLSSSSGGIPLGGSHNIAQEILSGTDESLDAVDFMAGNRDFGEVLDVSAVMERSRGI